MPPLVQGVAEHKFLFDDFSTSRSEHNQCLEGSRLEVPLCAHQPKAIGNLDKSKIRNDRYNKRQEGE